MAENFDVNLNDEVENFVVEFGEIQRITVDDFDKLRNRPSYDSQLMTHETNIPKVPANVSELNNDSDYQTGEEVAQALEAKQDKLTAGNNIQISEQNVISATDTVYSGGNGINISAQNAISVDTTIVATQQNLSNEVSNRENADIYLQGQIDAISASSDVVDIVGTYAELQAYDTTKLKDNDIIKVLQDETQGNATTYYRWSTHTETFTLIGQEGPYYTKASADTQFVPQTRTVNSKALSSNITLTASDVSALGTSDVVQTTGNSTSQVMSQKATTDGLATKLNITDYVVDTALADSTNPVQNKVLNNLLGNMPSDFFSGEATTTPTASTEVQFGNILSLDDAQLLGDTTQQTYSGKNLCALGTETVETYELFPLVKSLPAGTYTFSAQVTSTDTQSSVCFVRFMNGSSGVGAARINRSDERTHITVTTSDTADGIYLYAGYDGSGSSGDTATFTDIQIESGSSATSFEPYTNGPAPNPDYPQTVNVVTGNQDVWVHAKNLCDLGTQTFTSNKLFALTNPLPAGTYTFSARVASNDTGSTKCFVRFMNGNSGIGADRISRSSDRTSITITTNETTDGIYLYAGYDAAGSAGDTATFTDIQIEAGTATDYEPYQGANYTIDLGATELCKIATYQDKIYKSGSDWYVHKETSSYTFTGSEPISYNVDHSGFILRNTDIPTYMPDINTPPLKGFCSHFSVETSTTTWTGQNKIGLSNNSTLWAMSSQVTPASLQGWTDWLTTNTPTLYYALATPTDTKITDATLISELEALLSASTYDGETDFAITATGTNLPAPLQLTAINANAKGLIERVRA